MVPPPLDGHLRQQDPAAFPERHQQSVPAHLNLIGSNFGERGENRDLDTQFRQFVRLDRLKPGIAQGGGQRAFLHGLIKRLERFDDPDAAAQLP